MPKHRSYARRDWLTLCLASVFCAFALFGCSPGVEESSLTAGTRIMLMDWHIAGFWVINAPVAWVRVQNYNHVPIKEITFEYHTFTEDGRPLNTGTFTIEGEVGARSMKNFAELYLGIVDLYTQRLDIKLLSVRRAE